MAGKTDYKKLRERFLARQRRAERDERWWNPDKPPPGDPAIEYSIRILPPYDGYDSWYVEYGVHYGLNVDDDVPGSITCPRLTLGKRCPICEMTRGLWRGSDEDKALAGRIGAKRRYASNILVLSKDPNEVKIWAYGHKVWMPLNALCVGKDGSFTPIDDPQRGFNFNLTVTTQATPDGNFPSYMILPESMTPCPIPNMSVLDRLHRIDEVIREKVKSYDEIRAILMGPPDTSVVPEGKDETAEEGPAGEMADEVVVEEEAESVDEGAGKATSEAAAPAAISPTPAAASQVQPVRKEVTNVPAVQKRPAFSDSKRMEELRRRAELAVQKSRGISKK